ncbi:MAG TPA: hypothetical protein DCW52_01870 [Gammaproteobacteria bacterium]|nr:hypothetical protein [Gammaproteobacteria bacterium]
MRHQTKKSLTPGGKSGRSKIIQLETLNSLYFNMILRDSECAIFCCQILDHFESLMNKHYKGEPKIERSKRVDTYLALASLDKRGLK